MKLSPVTLVFLLAQPKAVALTAVKLTVRALTVRKESPAFTVIIRLRHQATSQDWLEKTLKHVVVLVFNNLLTSFVAVTLTE